MKTAKEKAAEFITAMVLYSGGLDKGEYCISELAKLLEEHADAKTEGKRYRAKQDNDCHWYLVPVEECKTFDEAMEADPDEWTDGGYEWLDSMRIDGPHNLTFTDPKEE